MKKGPLITLFDNDGNVVSQSGPDYDDPTPLPAPAPALTPAERRAVREGVTFHQQPCGSHIATAGHRRICGFPGDSRDIVAGVMLAWLAWERT
jgi:hypothetical protein